MLAAGREGRSAARTARHQRRRPRDHAARAVRAGLDGRNTQGHAASDGRATLPRPPVSPRVRPTSLTTPASSSRHSDRPERRCTPGGRQLHYGIREFAMSANPGRSGVSRRSAPGGIDVLRLQRLRPTGAIRLASLSDAGVLFVYTHDSVGVGEDGPTHQPVEHLMSLRAMPNLHVVRPSDANETLDLVEQFLSAKEPPTTAHRALATGHARLQRERRRPPAPTVLAAVATSCARATTPSSRSSAPAPR